MKNDANDVKKLAALLKRLKKDHASAQPPSPRDPVSELVYSFLQWRATAAQAAKAYDRLMAEMVDHNDLRVSHRHEVVERIGGGYPDAEERATRLRSTLQAIYLRERAVSLEGLINKPKKQVRAYLEDLSGIVPYVAARVLLVAFGAHATPVDEPLIELLAAEGVVEADATVQKVQSFLERRIKASESFEAHTLFQVWADAHAKSRPNARPRAGGAAKKTTKQKTTAKKPVKKKAPPKPKPAARKKTKKTAAAKTKRSTTKRSTKK